MSSWQDMSNFLFMSTTGLKVSQLIRVASSIPLHEAKPVLGLFCLHFNQGCGSGSSPFSVEAEVRKFYRFRFHVGYLP